MKFDNKLAAIHAYLCGDGYVIKNPKTQKHKYYYIGLRNTNETLLKDFQEKFESVFRLKPIITNEGRCKIQNKKIYELLTKDFSYYSYEWRLPKLAKSQLSYWLRAFFDCESWVENQPGKSRLIGLDCCNKSGLKSIQTALEVFTIKSNISKRKNRTIWRLTICGKQSLAEFQQHIGFLHPQKDLKLRQALQSYQNLSWKIPLTKNDLIKFIQSKGKLRKSHKKIRFFSVKKENLSKLKKALNRFNIGSYLHGPWKNNKGSLYYCLTIHTNWRKKWQDQKYLNQISKRSSLTSGK